jgi:hypothetical protein
MSWYYISLNYEMSTCDKLQDVLVRCLIFAVYPVTLSNRNGPHSSS